MAKEYRTPGIYIEEIPKLPPAIASVESAIPVFIGYTQKAHHKEPGDLLNKPTRIQSLLEYEQLFGVADFESGSLEVIFDNSLGTLRVYSRVDELKRSKFLMYYSMELFFMNGGGPCWIVSVGLYTRNSGKIIVEDLKNGLNESSKVDEVTLIVFPDSLNTGEAHLYYELISEAISQCGELRDRFTIFDIYRNNINLDDWPADIRFFRDHLPATAETLKFSAVYFPRIYTSLDYLADEETVGIVSIGAGKIASSLKQLKSSNDGHYARAKSALINTEMLLPVSPAIAGIYAQVDNARGVWKAPANINIDGAIRPEVQVKDIDQKWLNVDAVGGKSVNLIRSFPGRGPAMVWGARTLAGNDNEWRYISVRRFFIMIEESVKNATEQFVFEPNDTRTWVRVRSMIESYLTQQWRGGALMGTTTREAYFVHVGLGETMTQQDILEGRMIVEIGMAVVRPAEFIILRFMHKMLPDP